LQFSFGAEQNIGIALLEKLRPIVEHQPERLIRVRYAQSQRRRHDFSDLMFCDEAGDAA
jgi:hypothetical protein